MEKGEFLAYVGDSRIHDATILEIQHNGDQLTVALQSIEGQNFQLRFHEVQTVETNRVQGMKLYSLSELTSVNELRHFVFVNWDEDDDAILEVWAKGFE